MRRSARRQTVRATCSAAPGRGAAGRMMKRAQRRQLGFEPVDQLLEPDNVRVVDHRLGHARGELVGGIGELGAEREEIALQACTSSWSSAGSSRDARARPSQALSSSISP